MHARDTAFVFNLVKFVCENETISLHGFCLRINKLAARALDRQSSHALEFEFESRRPFLAFFTVPAPVKGPCPTTDYYVFTREVSYDLVFLPFSSFIFQLHHVCHISSLPSFTCTTPLTRQAFHPQLAPPLSNFRPFIVNLQHPCHT